MTITHLVLYTNHLQQQVQFYSQVLQLAAVSISDTAATYRTPGTTLTWHTGQAGAPYHFAFNIPANKATEAIAWLKQRVTLIPFEGKELVDFPNWNAESVYFYDADGNILEFIARKNLGNAVNEPFGPGQILNVSEVGLAVENIETTYNQLNQLSPLPVYWGNFNVFCAAGCEDGLFIIVDRHQKQWFPTLHAAHSANLNVYGDYNFSFSNGQIVPAAI